MMGTHWLPAGAQFFTCKELLKEDVPFQSSIRILRLTNEAPVGIADR